MNDFLVDLGARPTARRLVRTLGLPIPLPQKLRRELGPYRPRPLEGQNAFVSADGDLADVLASTLARAGARAWVEGDLAPFAEQGEAWSRPARPLSESTDARPHLLVFDGTELARPAELRAVYDFFHARIKQLAACGRVVVLARPASELAPHAAAVSRALEGFTRSLAKEIGRKGCTANLITVADGANERAAPVLRYLLSDRSAFVTGQPIAVHGTVHHDGEVPEVRVLEGRTALVTGAARGIGRSIALALAREGAHVLCLDLPGDDGPLARTAADVQGTPVLADITAPDALERIRSARAAARGMRSGHEIDILVNNAGITRDKTLGNLKPEWWDLTLAVNLEATIRLTQELPLAEGARVVCLSSIAGIAGNVGQTNYAASKCGVVGFVQASAPRLAERGIAINAIAPGFIETRLTKAIPTATREVARRLNALSQGGLPADIGEAACFLASPGAAGVSGSVLRVCGGNLVGA